MTEPMSSLLDLPREILTLILPHLSFIDYVFLMLTSNQSMGIFDNQDDYEKDWESNFAEIRKAYKWPVSDAELLDRIGVPRVLPLQPWLKD